jgi:YHS domain-containing protein
VTAGARRAVVLAGALAFAFGGARAQDAAPEPAEILDGVDPVLLLRDGKEVPGREALSAAHDGYRYLFASAETRAQFEKDPAPYRPAFGGTCARMGARTAGSPHLFAVHQGRVYLFGSDNCLRLFEADPARYLPHPPAGAPASAAARRRGAELLELAARAVGGAARLESLAGWRMETIRTPPAAQTQVVTVALPDRVREERRAPFGTVVNVLAGPDAFGLFVPPGGQAAGADRRPAPQKRALGEALRQEAALSLLAVLRDRRAADVSAAAQGAVRVGGVEAEVVEVRSPRAVVALAVDPASGRVLRLGYHGRGPEGAYGEVALDLTDHRQVDGWTLPFAVAGSFDGQPAPALGYAVTSWTLNPPLETSTFAPPARKEIP